MVRVPHHNPEHGGSIFLTTLSLSMGRRVRAGLRVSLPSIFPRREPLGRTIGVVSSMLVESVEPQSNSEPVELSTD